MENQDNNAYSLSSVFLFRPAVGHAREKIPAVERVQLGRYQGKPESYTWRSQPGLPSCRIFPQTHVFVKDLPAMSNTNDPPIPWYDYTKGGRLDPQALQEGSDRESIARCCRKYEDARVWQGPEENDGLVPNTHYQLHPLKKVLPDFELMETEYAGHAMQALQQESLNLKGFDAILVIGGDGTVHEVVNGLMFRSTKGKEEPFTIPPIGIIPGGTGNSTASSLDMGNSLKAIETILKGQTITFFDLGLCQFGSAIESGDPTKTRYMLQLLAWGLGVEANLRAENLRWMGNIRYDIAILLEILAGRQRNLRLQGVSDRQKRFELGGDYALALVMNCQEGGKHLRLAPYAKVNDGYLDLMAAENSSKLGILTLFDNLKRNGCHAYDPKVHNYRFQELYLDSPGKTTPIAIDGENCATTPIRIQVQPGAIRVFVIPPNEKSTEQG